MSGPLRLGVLVAGPIGDPVIVANASSPRVLYRSMPFEGLQAGVVYHHNVVGLLPLTAAYGSTQLAVRGVLGVGRHLTSELALHVAGPASGLPFLNRLMGSEPVRLDAIAHGLNTNFAVQGAASSARGIGPMAALFAMGPQGTVEVAPFWLRAGSGSLTGGYLLDRPHSSSAYWAYARGLPLRAIATRFPGITLPVIPATDGTLRAASIVGGSDAGRAALAGTVETGALRIASVPFAFAGASFDGSPSATRLTHSGSRTVGSFFGQRPDVVESVRRGRRLSRNVRRAAPIHWIGLARARPYRRGSPRSPSRAIVFSCKGAACASKTRVCAAFRQLGGPDLGGRRPTAADLLGPCSGRRWRCGRLRFLRTGPRSRARRFGPGRARPGRRRLARPGAALRGRPRHCVRPPVGRSLAARVSRRRGH